MPRTATRRTVSQRRPRLFDHQLVDIVQRLEGVNGLATGRQANGLDADQLELYPDLAQKVFPSGSLWDWNRHFTLWPRIFERDEHELAGILSKRG